MKRIEILILGIIVSCISVLAAPPTKNCIAVNKIVNQSTADEEFFRSIMERLQNAIVNTGKFDVVDNTRLYEIATELKKQEDGLSDNEVDVNLEIATISAHGAILSMIVESQDLFMHNQKYSKTVGTMEMTIRFQDMRSGKISASKQVKISKVGLSQQSNVMRDTSKSRKFTRIIEPEKIVKDPQSGKITVIPAKTQSIYFTPAEEKVYNEVMQGAVDAVVENLMEYVYPLYVVGVSRGRVYINLPEERSRQKITAGTRFEIVQLGEAIIDPDTGEILGAEEDQVMVVALETIRPKYIIATPIENAERLSVLEEEIKKYRTELKAAKAQKRKEKIKPPFQARQLEGNTKAPPSVNTSPTFNIENRFRR